MNKAKRKELSRAYDMLESAADIVRGVVFDETICLDNMPENLQSSQRYEDMENAVSTLEEAVYKIEGAQSDIEELT